MIHTHPFPARMAPEIALNSLSALSKRSVVLDPMCGSGMVLSQAARAGISSIGCDLDPLARLISKVGSTRVRESTVWQTFDLLMQYCFRNDSCTAKLPWIDKDQETREFVKFWFAQKQEHQLRRIAKFLHNNNHNFKSVPLNVLTVAVSRLIITKEPKASLARDTAHSRPHRTILDNDFDVYDNLEQSIHHVLKAINSTEILKNSTTYLADARSMGRICDEKADAIVTSPPYLNAIDYMRGHKFSLVWLGYTLAELRRIRGRNIGAELKESSELQPEFERLIKQLRLQALSRRKLEILNRYYIDLKAQLNECRRVLKRGGSALFVIGNSSVGGHYIKNSELLKCAAKSNGFTLVHEKIRDIPNNKRYLPIAVSSSNALSSRMRTEHVIEFQR